MIDFRATSQLCLEGLNYNQRAQWPEYPCSYPIDAPCLNRGASRPAKPTAECPHQYGFYPSLKATPDRCGNYRMCVEGRSLEMACPVGLAFNGVTGWCDWPEKVASCNVDGRFSVIVIGL
ncbi:Cuticular protein analogous to peritrophins 3-E [Operophtera brumata]|uniref:Cuticular protein analogous to peritrophins 3-E n=1 Tax=Operophtera brumata TaxID=104452 RepID=A0A0L7KU21_OPEBR|nr:Cuticular protein analogous to peritrophins 3-E [Operophtera brumata]